MLWGVRVIIPTKGRDRILKLLQQTHTGNSRMKGLARSYVWWSGMDQFLRSIKNTTSHHPLLHSHGLHPWEWPESPWSRINVDSAPHLAFLGEMFLLIVDAHSRWMDIYEDIHITGYHRETVSECFWFTKNVGLGQWSLFHKC